MLTDEQLVARAQAGDGAAMDAIVDRYEGVAIWVAADYFDPSGDRDDLRQEARIGILNAVRNYRVGRGGFRRFAFLCVQRAVISAVIAATRMSRAQLTFASRIATNDDGEQVQAVDLVEASVCDLDDLLADRERVRVVVATIQNELSPLEREWLIEHVLCGRAYIDIGPVKIGDNALVRARRKLARALEEAA